MKVIKRKPIYVAADGRRFKTEKECRDYEALAVSLQDYANQVKEVFNQNINKADGWSRIKRTIVTDVDGSNDVYCSDRIALMLLLQAKKYFLTQDGFDGKTFDIYDRFKADGRRVVKNGRICVKYSKKNIYIRVENGNAPFRNTGFKKDPLIKIKRKTSDGYEKQYAKLIENLQF